LVLIAGLAGLLIAVTIVLAFALGDREAATFDAGTPERAVQDYLRAIDEGNLDAAYVLLSSEYRRTTSLADFTSRSRFSSGPNADRVTVDDVEVNGDTARIRLQLRYGDVDGYESNQDVLLIHEDGAWHLRNPVS
jgi:hypothetical protein